MVIFFKFRCHEASRNHLLSYFHAAGKRGISQIPSHFRIREEQFANASGSILLKMRTTEFVEAVLRVARCLSYLKDPRQTLNLLH